MIQKYLVEVKRNSIIVYHETELSNVDYHAVIDGLDYAYQIIPSRISFSKPGEDWFLRGGNQVRYHANNQGENVRWFRVTHEFKCQVMETEKLELEKWHAKQKSTSGQLPQFERKMFD